MAAAAASAVRQPASQLSWAQCRNKYPREPALPRHAPTQPVRPPRGLLHRLPAMHPLSAVASLPLFLALFMHPRALCIPPLLPQSTKSDRSPGARLSRSKDGTPHTDTFFPIPASCAPQLSTDPLCQLATPEPRQFFPAAGPSVPSAPCHLFTLSHLPTRRLLAASEQLPHTPFFHALPSSCNSALPSP